MEREEVFDLLTLVGLRLSTLTAQGCLAMGLTEMEARVISCLASRGPARPGAVGTAVGASPRRMTQLMDSLDSKGHLVREVDATDARARILGLTSSGAALAKQIDGLRTAWAADLLRTVPTRELRLFGTALAAVLKKLEG